MQAAAHHGVQGHFQFLWHLHQLSHHAAHLGIVGAVLQSPLDGVGVAVHVPGHFAQRPQPSPGGLQIQRQLLHAVVFFFIFRRQSAHIGLQPLGLGPGFLQFLHHLALHVQGVLMLPMQRLALGGQFGFVFPQTGQIFLHLRAHGLLLGLGVAGVAQTVDGGQNVRLVFVQRHFGLIRRQGGFVCGGLRRIQLLPGFLQGLPSAFVLVVALVGQLPQLLQPGAAALHVLLHAANIGLQGLRPLLHAVPGSLQLMQLLRGQAAFRPRLADGVVQALHGLVNGGALAAVLLQSRFVPQQRVPQLLAGVVQLPHAGGQLILLEQEDIHFQRLELAGQFLIFQGALGLLVQGIDAAAQFVQQVLHAVQVFQRAVQLALGFLLAHAEHADARRLLKYLAAILALVGQNVVDAALTDVGIAVLAHAGIVEKLLDILQAAGGFVEEIFAVPVSVQPAGDGHFGIIGF